MTVPDDTETSDEDELELMEVAHPTPRYGTQTNPVTIDDADDVASGVIELNKEELLEKVHDKTVPVVFAANEAGEQRSTSITSGEPYFQGAPFVRPLTPVAGPSRHFADESSDNEDDHCSYLSERESLVDENESLDDSDDQFDDNLSDENHSDGDVASGYADPSDDEEEPVDPLPRINIGDSQYESQNGVVNGSPTSPPTTTQSFAPTDSPFTFAMPAQTVSRAEEIPPFFPPRAKSPSRGEVQASEPDFEPMTFYPYDTNFGQVYDTRPTASRWNAEYGNAVFTRKSLLAKSDKKEHADVS